MKIIERVIEYGSRSDEFTIHPLADIHHGARASDTARLERRLAQIDDDPLALWLSLGDNCDFINESDPRYDFADLPEWLVMQRMQHRKMCLPQLQRDDLARRINAHKTLGDKLLAWIEGNHEAQIRRHSEIDVYLSLLERIRPHSDHDLAPGVSGFLVLRFRRVTGPLRTKGSTFTVIIYMHHGFGGGDLAGGVNLKLERLMDRYEADIYLMGHHHKITQHTNAAQVRVNGALELEQPPDRYGAICGTYLRTISDDMDTYSERAGYRPTPVTSDILIKVRPDKKEIDMVKRSVRESTILA